MKTLPHVEHLQAILGFCLKANAVLDSQWGKIQFLQANGLDYTSPGHRPGSSDFKIFFSPEGADERVGRRLGRSYRALNMVFARYPGRCPGLVWSAPLVLGESEFLNGIGLKAGLQT